MYRAALILVALLTAPSLGWGTFAANNLSCTIYAPKEPGVLARCAGPFSGPGKGITIELHGTAPNQVKKVQLKFADKALPTQNISMEAEPVIDLETVGVLFMDFNFDGLEDLAVMEFLPAGPNVPYLFFLFDPSAGTFRANAALNALTSPEIKADTRQIISPWRDGAARSGRDVYEWHEGALVRVGRTEEDYATGACKAKTYERQAGKLVLKSQGECK